MNKILVFLALIGTFSFLPLQSASAAHCRVGVRCHGRVVAHCGVRVRGCYHGRIVRRCGPVVYRRPVYRVCGPRYCYPRPWGIGIGIRI